MIVRGIDSAHKVCRFCLPHRLYSPILSLAKTLNEHLTTRANPKTDAMPKVTYTSDFKADAIRQVLDLGIDVNATAQRLGIPDKTLALWVGLAQRERDGGADEVAKLRAEAAHLRDELRQIKEELDTLNEVAATVAKMHK